MMGWRREKKGERKSGPEVALDYPFSKWNMHF
jgi:hypothetical protein